MAFATVDDIADRLEEPGGLAAGPLASATLLLDLATAIVAQAVDRDEAWAAALTPVPEILRGLTIELVCRAMASPQGLKSATEQLGAYQRGETYRDGMSSHLLLTDQEAMLARRTVEGANTASPRVPSVLDDVDDSTPVGDTWWG